MLLFEGVDRCGKSTAALAVRKHLPGWSYRHHTKPMTEVYAYQLWGIADAHPRMAIDRLHWSDYAYANVYERGVGYTPHQWRMVELCLLTHATKVILMSDAPEAIYARWGDDEMYCKSRLVPLMRQYDDLLYGHSAPFVSHLPILTFKLPELLNGSSKPTLTFTRLLQQAEDDAARACKAFPPSVGCGALQPTFMVLGETPGDAFKGELAPGLPFDRGKAAEWMWKAFDALKLKWWEGYYTNASAFRDPWDFARYVNEVVTPKVILCLGSVAEGLVKAAKQGMRPDVQHVVTRHPSYVRRFEYDKFDAWVEELREVLEGYGCTL